MKPAPPAALLLLLAAGACNQGSSSYSLSGGEVGVFASRNAGSPISLDRLKQHERATGARHLRHPGARPQRTGRRSRALRYDSDACSLFGVYLSGSPWKVQFADAYDTHLRPLATVDQCAGSVAAQKGRVA